VPYEGVGVSEQGAIYAPSDNAFASPFLVVRTSGDPGRAAAAVQAELRRLDPTAPVTQLATGPDLFRDALTRPRHLTLLASLFATVALALAVVGIYGVTAYSVQQRRGDLAVRLALGSDPGAILGMTLWSGMRIATLGLLAGGFAALLVTRALAGLLYQVTPTDPGALVATAGLLLSVSALATLVPALRAVRVDPAAVLRQE
jgi:predicted lysophospholipase L1 biosynthesis ABC-type transport system permease subunit